MPQKYRPWFEGRGINIDEYTVTLNHNTTHLRGVHGRGLPNQGMPGRWNQRWADFVDTNPNATPKDVYQHVGAMMDEYGLSGRSIHPYGK